MTSAAFNPGGSIISSTGTSLLLAPGNGTVGIDGTSTRSIQTERNTSGAGSSLTVRAGGAASGATNTAGGDLVLSPGISTGLGRSWTRIQGYGIGNTGTADNSVVNRMISGGMSLNNSSLASVADVLVATNGQSAGGVIDYTVQASDGTNVQSETGRLVYNGVLSGGTYNTQIVRQPASTLASTGTLTVTWSIGTTAATKFTVQVTAASTGLTSPTLSLYYNLHNTSNVTTTAL